jgi:hypothetical protein
LPHALLLVAAQAAHFMKKFEDDAARPRTRGRRPRYIYRGPVKTPSSPTVNSTAGSMPVRAGKRCWPPSLNSAQTDIDKLYRDGGPANLEAKMPDKHFFYTACNEYPLQGVAPLMRRFSNDELAIRRHWPWVSFALSQYVYEVKERAKYSDERSPKEWKELLQSTAKAAHELANNLGEIQTAAHRLADPLAPLRRAHLAWFDELFARAAAGRTDSFASNDDALMIVDHLAKKAFLDRLVDIERSAKAALTHLDTRMLARKRGPDNPALDYFVWRIARIWESLTRRHASAQRLHSKDREDPDFVLLLSELAEIAGAPRPSRREIEISLGRNFRAPN